MKLADIIFKLEHSVQTEWSAKLTPDECKLLLVFITGVEELYGHRDGEDDPQPDSQG